MWTLRIPGSTTRELDIRQLDKRGIYSFRVYQGSSRSFFATLFDSPWLDNSRGNVATIIYNNPHVASNVKLQGHRKFSTRRIDLVLEELKNKGYTIINKPSSSIGTNVCSTQDCINTSVTMCNTCGDHYCSIGCHESGDACNYKIYFDNIERSTLKNDKQLDLVFDESSRAPRLQVGLQSINDEVPWEKHRFLTQFFRVESGTGTLEIGRSLSRTETFPLQDGSAAIVPAGCPHRIRNTGTKPLKLYSIYAKDSDTKEWLH